MTNTNELLLQRCASYSEDSLVATNYIDNETVKGNAFSALFTHTFLAAGTTQFTLDCPDGAFMLPIQAQASAGTLTIKFYEGTDYTSATDLGFINRNRKSTNVPTSKLLDASAGTDKGTLLATFVIGTAGRGAYLGGGSGSSAPYILNGDNYLIEVTATDACEATFSIGVIEYA